MIDFFEAVLPQAQGYVPIAGFEGLYEVSREGQVRSVRRTDSLGRQVGGRPIQPHAVGRGYLRATLYRGGKRYRKWVHHLVLEAFVGPQPVGQEALHLNDVPDDNRVENLRWGTPKENINMRDAGGHYNSKKTHCPRGHEYTEETTYRYKNQRQCRLCNTERARERREALRD